MVALTTERNTRLRIGDLRLEPVAAAVKIFGGSLVMRNAAGYLTKGATATACIGVGRAEKTVDNTAGAAGALSLDYRLGSFLFANLAADLVTIADIGKPCFIAIKPLHEPTARLRGRARGLWTRSRQPVFGCGATKR